MGRKIVIDQEEWRLERKIAHCRKMVSFAMSPQATYMWSKREAKAQLELDNHLASRKVEEDEKI